MNNKNEESDEKSPNIFELFDSFLLEKKRAYHSVQSYKTLAALFNALRSV